MAKILVVDNNETLARLIEEVLLADGHEVVLAGDGGSALDLVEAEEFDVAFIDLILPDICGLEILRTFKRKKRPTIPIIISGQVDINCAIASINAGVFHYLRKPFDIDVINRITRAAIWEKKRLSQSTKPAQPEALVKNITAGSGTAIRLIGDLLIATIGLFAGFVGIGEFFNARKVPFLWGNMELAYLIVSFACCYGFVYFNRIQNLPGKRSDWSRQAAGGYSGKMALKQDFTNLIFAYILFAAVLFFVTSYGRAGYAILAGAALGLAGFWLKNTMILPKLTGFVLPLREGRKKITIKSRQAQPAKVELDQPADDIHARANCSLTCLRYGHSWHNQSYRKAAGKATDNPEIASAETQEVDSEPSVLISELFGSRNLRAIARTDIKEGIDS